MMHMRGTNRLARTGASLRHPQSWCLASPLYVYPAESAMSGVHQVWSGRAAIRAASDAACTHTLTGELCLHPFPGGATRDARAAAQHKILLETCAGRAPAVIGCTQCSCCTRSTHKTQPHECSKRYRQTKPAEATSYDLFLQQPPMHFAHLAHLPGGRMHAFQSWRNLSRRGLEAVT